MREITQLLEAAGAGDRRAASDLLPLVYDELRRLASARMAEEKPGQTLQATALVHEAYLRLVGEQRFEHRGHFFGAAAEAMRRILVESARRKQSVKHGGGLVRHDADDLPIAAPAADDELLALDEALTRFLERDPVKGELVRLKYFGGFTLEEAAGILNISPATADRYWAYAKAWLFDAMKADALAAQKV